jgi:MoaA/NifB/PqqE/SkfB family radical SAM enzyme
VRKYSSPKGFKSQGAFWELSHKIVREDQLAASVQLYKRGEPLLNRDLPEIIGIAHVRNLSVAIFSNLNPKVDPILEGCSFNIMLVFIAKLY